MTEVRQPDIEVARARVRQLLHFMREFNQRRNPVPRDIDSYERKWWWHNNPWESKFFDSTDVADDADEEDDDGETTADVGLHNDFILRVERPTLEAAPTPPAGSERWLQPGWQDPAREGEWVDELDDPDEGTIAIPEELAFSLLEWKEERDGWAEQSREDYQAHRLFEWLWNVHAEMEREAEKFDMVLGDGQLAWDKDGVRVRHPLLLQTLQIDFDSSVPMFTIYASERPPEFYAALLRSVIVPAGQITQFLADSEAIRPSPLGGEHVDDFLQRVVTTLSPDGRFLGDGDAWPTSRSATIHRDPVLFLRNRAQGFEAAISAAISDVECAEGIPESLMSLVGVHRKIGEERSPVDRFEQGDEARDVLLTKEANREQLEIARRLERYGSVLVQGPPGTGKTHTIANLIGHLLAQEKRVLVTSHSTKALRVLREKVVKPLQPLCVSVLEGDAGSNEQLRESAQAIGTRLAEKSADQLDREAYDLGLERDRILDNIARIRVRLLECLQLEYRDIEVGGLGHSPSEAARLLFDSEERDGWIPGIVSAGPPPLTAAEVYALYKTNSEVSGQAERELARGLPALDALPTPEVLQAELVEREQLEPLAYLGKDLWANRPGRTLEELRVVRHAFAATFTNIAEFTDWELDPFLAGVGGERERQGWELLIDALRRAATSHHQSELAQRNDGARLNFASAEEAVRTLDEIIAHSASGGSFGRVLLLRKPKWKALLQAAFVIGGVPSTVEHFQALRAIPAADLAWSEAQDRYRLMLGTFGERLPGDAVAATRLADRIQELLGFHDRFVKTTLDLAAGTGLLTEKVAEAQYFPKAVAEWRQFAHGIVRNADAVFDAEQARLRLAELKTAQDSVRQVLEQHAGHRDRSTAVGALYEACIANEPGAYRSAHSDLSSLVARQTAARTRTLLLDRLRPAAPAWTEAISSRSGPHAQPEPPGDPDAAWRWKQLAVSVDEVSREDVAGFIEDIARLREELRGVSAELIDRRAWAGQARRTSDTALMALKGYVLTIARIGRGTGRRAGRFRAAARAQMEHAREAVPVWIAPMTRVAESFVPGKSQFDVVIIDEASQLDMMGLLAWYMGAQVIVVGDDQQVTPDDVGTRLAEVDSLIDTYLKDIPNHQLYDGQQSVYHLAQTAFRGTVRLREHFRCVPDIISFSSGLSYNWEILPLRPASAAPVVPHVIPYRVEGASRDGDINEEEARHIAALVQAMCEEPAYGGKTIGVISLLGPKQAPLIDQMIRERLPLDEIERRRLLCGAPAQFQGDERDIVLLSMVDSPRPGGGPLARRGDPGDRFKKRFNVAVSRARDQIWVVHSLDPDRDLQSDDLRHRLLEWAADPNALTVRMERQERRTESPFEREVLRRLMSRGYEVEAQCPAGAYRIDLVVGTGSNRLAVECDGDRYHASDERIRDDLDRQAVLERLGWRFHRIRGSRFYRNPEAEMERLCGRLSELEIVPTGVG